MACERWSMAGSSGAILPHALWPRGRFVQFLLWCQKGIWAVFSESSEPVTCEIEFVVNFQIATMIIWLVELGLHSSCVGRAWSLCCTVQGLRFNTPSCKRCLLKLSCFIYWSYQWCLLLCTPVVIFQKGFSSDCFSCMVALCALEHILLFLLFECLTFFSSPQ